MSFQALNKFLGNRETTQKMPALFVGHGSPMNAIEYNEFSTGWHNSTKEIPRPTAILCISAHWETRGTFVTAMEKPSTIHDFYGFPKPLFDVQYPAPGSPALAALTQKIVTQEVIQPDYKWGLDHGCWSILNHMYPEADIPIVQLSMNQLQKPEWHYQLARELAALRNKGVLIVASGNMVHNLRLIDWHKPNAGYDWAVEANQQFKSMIMEGDYQSLSNYTMLGKAVQQSIPTPEHFLPLLYLLGLQSPDDKMHFFNDKTIYGSISMTSVLMG